MPPKKTVASTTPSKPRVAKAVVDEKVTSNAHHIEENTKEIQNNTKMIHLLYCIIIVLMMIIAGLAFFVGTKSGSSNAAPVAVAPSQGEGVTITVLDDTRCTDCPTQDIITQLKTAPYLSQATIVMKDFSESGVSEYLQENNIAALPAVIFSTNILSDGGQMAPFLTAMPDGQFTLALSSTFDPFAKRSANGFLVLEPEQIQTVLAGSYLKWADNAQITWIEYTDLNCHFCQKMEDDGTAQTVLEKYPEVLNKTTHNFVGVGGEKTQIWSELLECIGKVAGADAYNSVLSGTLTSKDSSKDGILALAGTEGVDVTAVESCFDAGETKDIVASRFAAGQEVFGVTGTPGNIILNNSTGEYTLISGAYPVESFVETIDSLLTQ